MIHDMTTPTTDAATLDAHVAEMRAGAGDNGYRGDRIYRVGAALIIRRVEVDPSIAIYTGDDPSPEVIVERRTRVARREGIAWEERRARLLTNYIRGEIWNGIGLPSFKMAFEGGEPWWDLPTGNPDGQTLRAQTLQFLDPSNWLPATP